MMEGKYIALSEIKPGMLLQFEPEEHWHSRKESIYIPLTWVYPIGYRITGFDGYKRDKAAKRGQILKGGLIFVVRMQGTSIITIHENKLVEVLCPVNLVEVK